MGVKQTTDVLEKGTWIFGGLIAVLCVVSVVFMPKNVSTGVEDRLNQATGTGIPAPKPATQPATQPPAAVPAPAPATPAPGGK
jgi:preprotein translocase subunit SecG